MKLHCKVKDFIQYGKWNIPNSLERHLLVNCNDIRNCTIPTDSADLLIWEKRNDGLVSFQSLHTAELPPSDNVSYGKYIWEQYIPPMRCMVIWKILHLQIATEVVIQNCGYQLASCCILCYKGRETLDHLFLSCLLLNPYGMIFLIASAS